jgi:hypothetical protein
VSHFKERKEKICLNCGAEVQGRYCGVCGQENIEPQESAWHLVTHFFNDITHFDGKFFSTVKYLLLKPGFLTAEYVRGRRARYLHPIRMYVFTSAFFFLIYFSFISGHGTATESGKGLQETLTNQQDELQTLQGMLTATKDTGEKAAIQKAITKYEYRIRLLTDSLKKESAQNEENLRRSDDIADSVITIIPFAPSVRSKIDSARKTSRADSAGKGKLLINNKEFFDFTFYKDEATYKAVQDELPAERKDGRIERTAKLKLLHWHNEEKKESGKLFNTIMEKFKHSFPTILFISLPLFAFFLKLLYIRRKSFYYAGHGIFSIHAYCAVFILLLLYYMLDGIQMQLHWRLFSLIKTVVVLYMIYYVYKAMRNFYKQARLKTMIKYLLLSWMTFIVMIFLVVIFFIISAYKV